MGKDKIVKEDYAAREERKHENKRKQIIQHHAFQKNEGIQYQPHGFHSNSKCL